MKEDGLMELYEWVKPDVAAIMFTSLQHKNASRVCRMSVVFKEEEVRPEVLRQAVAEVMHRFPGFWQSLRIGAFWGYLEQNNVMPEICEETEAPAMQQYLGRFGGPDFRILYFKRRFALEVSHALGDGHGFLTLILSIASRYLTLRGIADTSEADCIFQPFDEPSPEDFEVANYRYHTKEKLAGAKHVKSYQLPLVIDDEYLKLIFGLIPIDEVKKQCKPKQLTITDYLASAMILAIIRSSPKPINETISIAVPVDMRKFFPTTTTRNFTCDVPIIFNPHGGTSYTFDEICNSVRGQLKSLINKENMQAFINSTYGLTKNPVIRVIPSFVKFPALRQLQKISHQMSMTLLLSNLGNITLPENMYDKVERVDFIGGDARQYGQTTFCSATGLNGYINFCFSINNHDTAFPKNFFRILSENGINVRVESSDGNGVNSYEM